jgi:alpha-glucosidase
MNLQELPKHTSDHFTGSGYARRYSGSPSFSVDILEEWLVRVRILPDGISRLDRTWMILGSAAPLDIPKEGRNRDDYGVFSCPEWVGGTAGTYTFLKTDSLEVRIDRETTCLSWYDAAGNKFAGDLPSKPYIVDTEGRSVFHYLVREPREAYYGFGERTGPLNKRGSRMRMQNLDALGYDARTTDPLYKHWPIYITFRPDLQIAYGLIYDNLADTVFDLGREIDAYHKDYRYWHAEDGDIDYYMVFGPSIQEVVKRISLLIGRIPLPPRWSLGYLGSGMGYTDSTQASFRLDEFAQLCIKHDIPCDMFHLSSGYSMSNDNKRYVFAWNRDRVPEPESVSRLFHQAGIKVAANIKPCLLDTHPEYQEADGEGLFLQDDQGPHLSMFWGGRGSYIDFTSESGYRWWKRKVTEEILDYGIDATWNDNNEYEIWNSTIQCEGFGRSVPIALVKPVQSLLMTRASSESQRESSPGLRPYLICRSGCPGVQRYAQSWSGDNSTSWETLRYNIPMGLGLSISGQPNTGHDVGGFWGDAPSPELFIRWIQNGILHPRFSIHSWRLDGTASEPWMYPEITSLIRELIRFRYRLIPYFYSLFAEASKYGTPIIRPLIYQFPEDPRLIDESFDFLIGPKLLAASVFTEGARRRDLYLPAGTDWCDIATGKWYPGATDVTVPAPLERIPLLAAEGALIPMGRSMQYVGSEADNVRQVLAFPGKEGSWQFDLVEDDGVTNDYREGRQTILRLQIESDPSRILLGIEYLSKGYQLPYTVIDFLLPQGEKRPVACQHQCEESAPLPDGRRVITITASA